jgi:hypothetical protein
MKLNYIPLLAAAIFVAPTVVSAQNSGSASQGDTSAASSDVGTPPAPGMVPPAAPGTVPAEGSSDAEPTNDSQDNGGSSSSN